MIEKFRKLLPAVLMVAMAAAAVPAWGQAGAPMVVGRVSHVEGDLLRWVPQDNDWVAVVRDVPLQPEMPFIQGPKAGLEVDRP